MMFMAMIMTAGAADLVFMVMVMTAGAADLVFMVMVMTAAAFFMVFMVMMVMTAATAIMMLMMVMFVPTGTTFMMFMMVVLVVVLMVVTVSTGFTGRDHHIGFHLAGNRKNLGQQGIGILCGDLQLLGGKSDACGYHLVHGIDFIFYTGGAVGAVQIIDDVHFLLHRKSSFENNI